MAGKPEQHTQQNVQNVVVYLANDSLAYVNQQNVGVSYHQAPVQQNVAAGPTGFAATAQPVAAISQSVTSVPQPVTTLVSPTKGVCKQTVKSRDFTNTNGFVTKANIPLPRQPGFCMAGPGIMPQANGFHPCHPAGGVVNNLVYSSGVNHTSTILNPGFNGTSSRNTSTMGLQPQNSRIGVERTSSSSESCGAFPVTQQQQQTQRTQGNGYIALPSEQRDTPTQYCLSIQSGEGNFLTTAGLDGSTIGPAGTPVVLPRCDSVRSETAESSCSSLSSGDSQTDQSNGTMTLVLPTAGRQASTPTQSQLIPNGCVALPGPIGGSVVMVNGPVGIPSSGQQSHTTIPLPQEQLSNIVLAMTVPSVENQQQSQSEQSLMQSNLQTGRPTAPVKSQTPNTITVPLGWRRIVITGSVVYISPSNTALRSMDHLKEYLQTSGTCKCGLECPLKCDTVFSFDPKVATRPWTSESAELSKLCNHTRKLIAMASLASATAGQTSGVENVGKGKKEPRARPKRRKTGASTPTPPEQQSPSLPQNESQSLSTSTDTSPVNNKDNNRPVQGWSNNLPMQYQQHQQQQSQISSLVNRIPFGNPTFCPDAQYLRFSTPQQTNLPTALHQQQISSVMQGQETSMSFQQSSPQQVHANQGNCIQENSSHINSNNEAITNSQNLRISESDNPLNKSHQQQQQQQFQSMQQQLHHQHPQDQQNVYQDIHMQRFQQQQNYQQQQQQQQQQLQSQNQQHHPQLNSQQQFYLGQQCNSYQLPNDSAKIPSQTIGFGQARPPFHPTDCNSNMHYDSYGCRMPSSQQQPHLMQQVHVNHGQMMPGNHQMISNAANNSQIIGTQHRAPPWQQNRTTNNIIPLPHQHLQQQQLQQIQQQQQQMQQLQHQQQQHQQQQQQQIHSQQPPAQVNIYERVPPLHHHTPPPSTWQEESSNKKKPKTSGKGGANRKQRANHSHENRGVSPLDCPCPNVDVRQIPLERPPLQQQSSNNPHYSNTPTPISTVPSFMEDPSGYLAQQTALLNSTISRQTGVGNQGFSWHSPTSRNTDPPTVTCSPSTVGVPLPSNVLISASKMQQNFIASRPSSNHLPVSQQSSHISTTATATVPNTSVNTPDSTGSSEHKNDNSHCQACLEMNNTIIPDSIPYHQNYHSHSNGQQPPMQHQHPVPVALLENTVRLQQQRMRYTSLPNPQCCNTFRETTAGYCGHGAQEDNPVTSSTFSEKFGMATGVPDSRGPIQGGTVSTSTGSPAETAGNKLPQPETSPSVLTSSPQLSDPSSTSDVSSSPIMMSSCCSHLFDQSGRMIQKFQPSAVVTTMASGHTVSCNTITSVLAGRTNTATVSVGATVSNTPPSSAPPTSTTQTAVLQVHHPPNSAQAQNSSKSPLEMVQSVVSNIQLPNVQPPAMLKPSASSGLTPGHILVSSNGQLIMTNAGLMAPPAQPGSLTKIPGSMPPMSVSPMVTNVTAAVTQVIPAVGVAQQVLGQPTVLVNALHAPLLIQPGMMTVDGVTGLNQNTVQIPHLAVATGNVIHPSQNTTNGNLGQLIDVNHEATVRAQQSPVAAGYIQQRSALMSPEISQPTHQKKKSSKKRKVAPQTVASMLHIASQQNSSPNVMLQQQSQQQNLAHQGFTVTGPQGLTAGTMLQALTIVPGKGGSPAQILMNSQPGGNTGHFGTQQIIATPATSQAPQQINLLQPVNLLNGATGVVQNFPAFQQFIVPGIGGMVMTTDGTAAILPDTANIGVQLQLQNVNGQNVLTPVPGHSGHVFGHPTGQSILTAGATGMVIRAPAAGGKITSGAVIQQQSPAHQQYITSSQNGNQFLVNGTATFNGQLSPLVANVSPGQQMSFTTTNQSIRPQTASHSQQEFIQCGQMGQTLMVPCPVAVTTAQNHQNTVVVEQNTTIVQQQTTMVSNNQHLLASRQTLPNNLSGNTSSPESINHQNFMMGNSGCMDKCHSNLNPSMQGKTIGPQSTQLSLTKHSVSTQTAANQTIPMSSPPGALVVTTNNMFCQTGSCSGSPPDTTTHSPIDPGSMQSPAADTTTHSIGIGSIDESLSSSSQSPLTTSSCGDSRRVYQQSLSQVSMPMVHCISSSNEQDNIPSVGGESSDFDWNSSVSKGIFVGSTVSDGFGNNDSSPKCMESCGKFSVAESGMTHRIRGASDGDSTKCSTGVGTTYVESSTLVGVYGNEVVTSRQMFDYGSEDRRRGGIAAKHYLERANKRKHADSSLHDLHFMDDEDEVGKRVLSEGDLVWGAAKGSPAWPGKLVSSIDDKGKVMVHWFGGGGDSLVLAHSLKTLSEGLEAHHHARKKFRKSRKLNLQLENAIQEAMSELDHITEKQQMKGVKDC